MNLTRGINLRKIAEKMTGSSGAEVKVGFSGCLASFGDCTQFLLY
jgi:ATP-dependent 26S proteasome regulatory subunit